MRLYAHADTSHRHTQETSWRTKSSLLFCFQHLRTWGKLYIKERISREQEGGGGETTVTKEKCKMIRIYFVKIYITTLDRKSASDLNSWTFCSILASLQIPFSFPQTILVACRWSHAPYMQMVLYFYLQRFVVAVVKGKKYSRDVNFWFQVWRRKWWINNLVSHNYRHSIICCQTAIHLGMKCHISQRKSTNFSRHV
jgi:hypothetical protein